jgi:hypothetical protein
MMENKIKLVGRNFRKNRERRKLMKQKIKKKKKKKKKKRKEEDGLRSSTIICSNLREFRQVIVRDHLWDPPDQLKIELFNHLSDQVSPISGLSKLHFRILSNSNK